MYVNGKYWIVSKYTQQILSFPGKRKRETEEIAEEIEKQKKKREWANEEIMFSSGKENENSSKGYKIKVR